MTGPAEHLVTAEELYANHDHERYELVRGALRVCEPPGGIHGRLAARITYRLQAHVEQHGLGTVLVEAGYVLQRNPDTVRGPDISFISATRMAPDQIPAQYIPGSPDLAIEILSPNDRWHEVEEKVADYLASGARMVWVVDPRRRCVIVRYPDRAPRVAGENEALDGEDVVPGFRCAVGEVFGSG